MKFIVMGMKQRGLWLASELAQKGFDVTWMSVGMSVGSDKLVFDDMPWQAGPTETLKKLPKSLQKFIQQNFKTQSQKGLQILHPEAPFEFAGPFFESGLKHFFGKGEELLSEYFAALTKDNASLVSAIEKKLFKLPLSQRWILEWTKELTGARYQPQDEFIYFEDGYRESLEPCLQYAEKAGVKTVRGAKILDVGFDGSKVTGVEIEDMKGFRACDHLVLSCPARMVEAAKGLVKNPRYVWVKYQFEMKPHSRPVGLYEFSSFVLDPCMRLEGAQFGLLRWHHGTGADDLNVWTRIDFEEAKKESVLSNVGKAITTSLTRLMPGFETALVGLRKIDANISEATNKFVYETASRPQWGLHKKNLWLAGPETDEGYDLLSSLETESKILNTIEAKFIKKKGTNKDDRKIHQGSHGEAVVD